jgi:hypothetical protein
MDIYNRITELKEARQRQIDGYNKIHRQVQEQIIQILSEAGVLEKVRGLELHREGLKRATETKITDLEGRISELQSLYDQIP